MPSTPPPRDHPTPLPRHVYAHLKRELAQHSGMVEKYIVMHDTVVDGKGGGGGGGGGVGGGGVLQGHLGPWHPSPPTHAHGTRARSGAGPPFFCLTTLPPLASLH